MASGSVPGRDALVEFRQFCTDEAVEFSLSRLYTPDRTGSRSQFGLTAAQRETLVTAHEQGYFEVPREATLTELGTVPGVSEQSVSERLRRAHERLVTMAVLTDGEATLPRRQCAPDHGRWEARSERQRRDGEESPLSLEPTAENIKPLSYKVKFKHRRSVT